MEFFGGKDMNQNRREFRVSDRKLYEKGLKYLQTENVIKRSRDAWQFFHDRQWEGLERSEVFGKDGPPFINFIKPDVLYKMTTVGQRNARIVFSPAENTNEGFLETAKQACDELTAYAASVWESAKLDSLRWRAIRDAVVVGDGLIHFAGKEDKDGEVSAAPELIDSVNVFYSDENESDIQKQDYILISYRRLVTELRKEARDNGLDEEEISRIVSDEETEGQANDAADRELETSEAGSDPEEEASGKALVILKYWRGEDGLIRMRKSVSQCVIMPEKQTGLSLFPIAKLAWEEVKNRARGNGIVNALIPNQIEYNKTLARRTIKVMEAAYPKLVYNETMIDNPEDLDDVGAKIAVRGSEAVKNMIDYLNPSTMSQDVQVLSNDLMKLTQEMSGASEAALGKINPEQASGRAILAVQDASAQIMSLQMQQHEQFVEDIARILLDFWVTYAGENGKTIHIKDENGELKTGMISKDVLDNLRVNVKIEVSPTGTYSLIAVEQTLENYLSAKYITFEELVEALPDGSIAPKQILKSILQKRARVQAQAEAEARAAAAQAPPEPQSIPGMPGMPGMQNMPGMTPSAPGTSPEEIIQKALAARQMIQGGPNPPMV